jgi:hypothetical protein
MFQNSGPSGQNFEYVFFNIYNRLDLGACQCKAVKMRKIELKQMFSEIICSSLILMAYS